MDVAKHPKPLPLGEERVSDGETKAWPPSQRQWHPAPTDLSSPQGARRMRRLERQAPKSDDTPWSTPLGGSPQSSRPARALGTLGAEQRQRSEHGHRLGPTMGAGMCLGCFHGCLGAQSLQGVGIDPPTTAPTWDRPLAGVSCPGMRGRSHLHAAPPLLAFRSWQHLLWINPSCPPPSRPGLTPSAGAQLELSYIKTRPPPPKK